MAVGWFLLSAGRSDLIGAATPRAFRLGWLGARCDGDVPVGGLFLLLTPAAPHPGGCPIELVYDVGVRGEE